MSDPVLDKTFTYGILIVLSGFLIWMERNRRSGLFPLRILAALLIVLALAGILIRPMYKTSRPEQTILLTADYQSSQADSIINLYPSMEVFRVVTTPPFKSSNPLKSRGDLADKQVAFILGQGLPADSLEMLALESYQFIPSKYPEGIIRLSIPRNIFPGRTTIIEGVYNNTSSMPLTLMLNGPGGKEDSVKIFKRGYQNFELSLVPAAPGNYLFSIQSGDLIHGQLPVRVEQHQPLDILFVQQYPAFETRNLKDFLSRHHRLIVRTQLSKNRFRHEYVNRARKAMNRLTRQALSEFDLIVIDTDALEALSSFEKNNLRSAIKDGLGMLALFNTNPARANEIKPLAFEKYAIDTAHIHAGEEKKTFLPAWPSKEISESTVIPVLKTKSRVLSGYRYFGMGKIGFQLLQQTYGLALQGDSSAYSEIWTNLVEQISRTRDSGIDIHEKSRFPFFPDRPIALELISSGERPVMSVNGIAIPLKENILIDDLWKGIFWADKPGWNTIKVGVDSVKAGLYVSDPGEWHSLAIANKLDETAKYAGSFIPGPKFQTMHHYVPVWIFYFLFLAGAGCLWLVPRL